MDRYVSVSTMSSGSNPGVALCLVKEVGPASTKRNSKSPRFATSTFRGWLPGGTEFTWTVTSSSLPGNSETTPVCSVEMGSGTKRPETSSLSKV